MKHSANRNTRPSKTEYPFAIPFISAIIVIMISGIINFNIFAQTNKQAPAPQVLYSNSQSTNDIQSLTTVQPHQNPMSPQEQNLLGQLDAARSSNNMQLKSQLESQLNQLNGTSSVQLTPSVNTRGGIAMGENKPGHNDPDYVNSTVISGSGIWSSATQTVPAGLPNAGRIWVASTVYSAGVSDTCKIYYSDDGGQTWNYAYYFYFFDNSDFRPGELDIELAYDGSAMWLYGVAGYSDFVNGRSYSLLFRFNTSTNIYSGYNLLWPGYATTTNRYYNPRITSDNSNYTTATYIYVSCSFDSTYSGTQHFNKLKYAYLPSPFAASPVINYPNNLFGSFYWYSSTVPANTYLWTDIAYFRTSGGYNRIITVYNVPGSGNYNIYYAWSDNYGSTTSGSSIAETHQDYGAKIAFNGGSSNLYGMIVYVRNYSGNDWDPYYLNTLDGGATWAGAIIDPDVSRCRSVDITAIRSYINQFKVAYTQDATGGTRGYYAGFFNGSFSEPYPTAISSPGVDTVYTKAIAGYRIGGGDDCFAVYSMGSGSGLYSSRLCQSTLGISNQTNETPAKFNLAQNYPNPFNPSTSIKFSVTASSFVKLVVYDITGKVLSTLVDQNLNAGTYNYSFNASQLASGVYFYRISAKSTDGSVNFTDVKKMMLIK